MTAADVEPELRLDCLGVSHRTASPEIRERTGFSAARLRDALSAARHDPRIERLVIVSTCHRTELYAAAPASTARADSTLLEWWSARCAVTPAALSAHCYSLSGIDAARHLFRVSVGLDSVVLGEAQIVAQVAAALRQSVAVHAASPLLKLAFKSAVRAGERARRRVWGRLQAASLGSAAVDAAASATVSELSKCNVIVIGAGEIAELALRALHAQAPARVTVVNRTVAAAQELADRYDADAGSLDDLGASMLDADVVIAATRATRPLVSRAAVAAAMEQRAHRPMTIVDVSLPRNVDVAVRSVDGATLIGIDDLGSYVAAAHAERQAVVPSVECIVEEEIELLRAQIALRTPPDRMVAEPAPRAVPA